MSVATRSREGAKKIVEAYRPSTWRRKNWRWRIVMSLITLLVINIILMFWWSSEPEQINVEHARIAYLAPNEQPVDGSAMVGTTIAMIDTLLHKPGGFLMNDKMPPSVLMDNMPSWEYGVLMQIREMAFALRNNFSRAQLQSTQMSALETAENDLRNDADKWILPSPESKYQHAHDQLIIYARAIADRQNRRVQFYTRADNLISYLDLVSKTLGDFTQRLSASVEDVAIDSQSNHSADISSDTQVLQGTRTPWLQLDNVFYEARGYSWALLLELKAMRMDFKDMLQNKNAVAAVNQIILALQKAQNPIWSPIILNGRGFGFTANHSLVMASYLSRANAAIVDLIQLLKHG